MNRESDTMGDDASFHDAFARLGNDLATAERRLIKANAELSSAHEELRALYEALPLGAFKIDNHGTVLQANRRFHALTGLSGPATWFDGAHPLDAERVMRHWQDAVGAALDVRYRHVSPTGLAVDLRVKLVPFHDD
ncbi:PAS domain-containing protein, partial [Fodinicurvata sp. EGI_FJ10296]|uniref:PAS domain-containing protein n=1 Tax=Fodinicurvata sp. EGI_FJ10296 TaxID=3231908 RepID=UPI0034554E67